MMKVAAEVLRMQILVNKKAVQEYRGPSNTLFIEGRIGSEFELELTNLTPRRILVHPTVDGLSAMNGKTASKEDSSDGYVLSCYQRMTIPGWRLNNNEVANFVFAGQGQSYAEQTGRGADKGVIACTIWEEKTEPLYFGQWDQSRNFPEQSFKGITRGFGGGGTYSCNTFSNPANSFNNIPGVTVSCTNDCSSVSYCSTGQPPSEPVFIGLNAVQNLGTGFGKKADHQVVTVNFTAQDHPTCTAIIYYDDLQGLRNRGVKISQKKPEHNLPNPFPRDCVGCTPPRGWKG